MDCSWYAVLSADLDKLLYGMNLEFVQISNGHPRMCTSTIPELAIEAWNWCCVNRLGLGNLEIFH